MSKHVRKKPPPNGGFFVARSQVMDASSVQRAIRRMAYEITERNEGLDRVVLVSLQTGGVVFGEALAAALTDIKGEEIPTGTLDVAFYRDDIAIRPVTPEAETLLNFDVTDRVVILVDDVLYTGRTIRAALAALGDMGRARRIQLAVMVDRGHRELPIRPDYVGKNLPTRRDELVKATLDGVEIGEVR